jgi:hypothetical protein
MARELADGRDPTSDVKVVEQLRAAVAAAERKSEALVFAIEQAEDQFGEAIVRNRQRWTSASTKGVSDAREAAGKALAELTYASPKLSACAGATSTSLPRPTPSTGNSAPPAIGSQPPRPKPPRQPCPCCPRSAAN